jgi:hypothetical protein
MARREKMTRRKSLRKTRKMRGGDPHTNAFHRYNAKLTVPSPQAHKKLDLIQQINGMLSKYNKSQLTRENTVLLNNKDIGWLQGHLDFLKEEYEPQPKKKGLFW